ncbi:MAG TPA: aspartyl protease family protein [Terriglobales bacterium]|nr:aspartyl protease family protein [Terriglobales bacterium]
MRKILWFVFLFWACSLVAETKPTTIGFELIDNRIFVDVKLNGKGPYRMIFDTGAVAGLATNTAQAAGLAVQSSDADVVGVGEQKVQMGRTMVDRLEFGPVVLEKQEFLVVPMDDSAQVFGTKPMEGIIGQPVFEKWVVAIDYDAKTLTFTRPELYRANPKAIAIPFTRPDQIPLVEAELDGITGTWGVDTGARTALIVANKFGDSNKLREKYKAQLEGITGWGLGGPVRSLLARAKSFKIGTAEVNDIIIRLSTQKAGALASASYAGLIGPDVLRQFKVTFDYSRSTMYLEPGKSYGMRDSFDRSGMWMGQTGDYFEVLDVIPSGPADESGIKKGDRITVIDGVPTSKLLLPAARDRMRKLAPGTKVTVKIKSGQTSREVILVLRDLV